MTPEAPAARQENLRSGESITGPGIIVVGNQKGGSGKTTIAFHLIAGLMRSGYSVGSVDLDGGQLTLSSILRNRQAFRDSRDINLDLPEHHFLSDDLHQAQYRNVREAESWLENIIPDMCARHDVIVIDTPGHDTPLNMLAHACGDILLTTLNDSFVDLDVILEVSPATLRPVGLSHYGRMIRKAASEREAASLSPARWLVLQNRVGLLRTNNRKMVEEVLSEASRLYDFELLGGLSERVVFRELFTFGLTVYDLERLPGFADRTRSQVHAEAELDALVEAICRPSGQNTVQAPGSP